MIQYMYIPFHNSLPKFCAYVFSSDLWNGLYINVCLPFRLPHLTPVWSEVTNRDWHGSVQKAG